MIKNTISSSILICIALFTLASCGDKQSKASPEQSVQQQEKFAWKLVTSWPKNFPGLGMAPEKFANYVNAMSNGR